MEEPIVITQEDMRLILRILNDEVKRCGEPTVEALLNKFYDIASMEKDNE